MPEKKNGVFEIIRGMFKSKKQCCDDIICQADRVIADYVTRRRNDIICKYENKPKRCTGVIIACITALVLFTVYRLAV